MTGFILAWQFLTILPGGRHDRETSPELLGRSLAFYPLVGLLLGLILWGAFLVLSFVFPRTLCDGLVLVLLVLLTGALHLDGTADTLDGMALGRSAEERLVIMKDHRVGAFGVVGLIAVLGMKFLALNALPEEVFGFSIVAALTLSRWSMVQLIYRTPYARPEGGLGKAFKDHVGKREMVIASLLSLVIAVLLFRFWGALVWLAIGFFTLGIQVFFQRKIGGMTGDVLGATNELNELLALLILAGIFHGYY